ncbi:hypothetical protein PV04_05371 [Phialophora macrospora]|uniref:Maltose/galactoside acetyltransferase domain-containing protein n=1 Tax=Phialophora macrospora TaxID=1851006 RepID=A0A0D2FMV8_9EURO|nr:hypothetical protein PV04_05371 [Phialophora macrospora]
MASVEKNNELIELARTFNHIPWSEHYEEMISGMMYNPNAPELIAARMRARSANEDFNTFSGRDLPFDQVFAAKNALLKNVVGRIGEGSFFEAPFHADYGCNVSVGKDSVANFNLVILDTSLVIIGDRVQMGPNVSIYTVNHSTSVLSRRKYVEYGHPIRIEDDCWIGGGVTILPGVTVGKGSTVGAGSVVTKSIPPYSVAIGSPARVVKTVPTVEEEEADVNNPYRNLVRKF